MYANQFLACNYQPNYRRDGKFRRNNYLNGMNLLKFIVYDTYTVCN